MSPRMPNLVLVLVLFFALSPPALTAVDGRCDESSSPRQKLSEAYQVFCATFPDDELEGPPERCENPPRAAEQWTVLAAVCPALSSEPYCTTFFCANADAAAARCRLAPLTLDFDHSTASWEPVGPLRDQRFRWRRDVNGRITVTLGRDGNQDLVVRVIETNPLLYGLTAKEVTEKEIEQLAQLQQLAGLLGGGIQNLVQAGKVGMAARTAVPTEISAFLIGTPTRAGKLNRGKQEVERVLFGLRQQSEEAASLVQAVELGENGEYPLRQDAVTRTKVTQAFDALEGPWFELIENPLPCRRKIERLLELADAADGAGQGKRTAFRADTSCADLQDVDNVLVELEKEIGTMSPEELRRSLAPYRVAVQLDDLRLELITEAGKLIAGEADARKAVSRLTLFERRLRDVRSQPARACSVVPGRCIHHDSVLPLLILPEMAKVRWDKTRTHPIEIAVDSPLADAVVPARPKKVETSFGVRPESASLWGLGVSLVATSLASPEFKAVEEGEGGAAQTVIRQSGEDSRTGELALLADYAFVRKLWPDAPPGLRGLGIEFGAALDTDDPGLFAGLSYRIGRYVRLGAGYTYQQVQELAGQELGDPVADSDAIKTRDDFEGEVYYSLSVSLRTLNLFSGE